MCMDAWRAGQGLRVRVLIAKLALSISIAIALDPRSYIRICIYIRIRNIYTRISIFIFNN